MLLHQSLINASFILSVPEWSQTVWQRYIENTIAQILKSSQKMVTAYGSANIIHWLSTNANTSAGPNKFIEHNLFAFILHRFLWFGSTTYSFEMNISGQKKSNKSSNIQTKEREREKVYRHMNIQVIL